MTRFVSVTVLLMTPLMIAGCGGDGAAPESVTSSEGSVTKGVEAVAAKDWATAETELVAAIKAGALQPDQAEIAMLNLSKARIELGKTDEAAIVIQDLERGAAAMDEVLATKAALLLKKGDTAGAKAAFAEARKLNPKVTAPAGL